RRAGGCDVAQIGGGIGVIHKEVNRQAEVAIGMGLGIHAVCAIGCDIPLPGMEYDWAVMAASAARTLALAPNYCAPPAIRLPIMQQEGRFKRKSGGVIQQHIANFWVGAGIPDGIRAIADRIGRDAGMRTGDFIVNEVVSGILSSGVGESHEKVLIA